MIHFVFRSKYKIYFIHTGTYHFFDFDSDSQTVYCSVRCVLLGYDYNLKVFDAQAVSVTEM